MKSPRKLHCLWLAIGLALSVVIQDACGEGVFRAYSLQQAARAVSQTKGSPAKAVLSLGGITRPIALVLDGELKDIILVGEVVSGHEPASLDDLVVALRATTISKVAPLVSIDRTAETDTTGKQHVRFEGGVEDTQFGKDLLEADIILKKLGLGLLPMPKGGADCYADLAAKRWLDANDELFLSRFWFKPADVSQVDIRKGIAVLDAVSVVVLTETVEKTQGSEPASRDLIGEQFATDISTLLGDLAQEYRSIRRLEPLLRLAGLMQAVPKWQVESPGDLPDLSYWIHSFRIRTVPTDREVTLLRSKAVSRTNDQNEFSVDGGIDTEVVLADLKDGSAEALRQLVLLARPSGDALIWEVPLGAESVVELQRSLGKGKRIPRARKEPEDQGMSLRERVRMPDGREFGAKLMDGTSLHGTPSVRNTFREVQEGPTSATSEPASRPKVYALGTDRVKDLSSALYLAAGSNERTAILGSGPEANRALREHTDPSSGFRMGTSFYAGSYPIRRTGEVAPSGGLKTEKLRFEPVPILSGSSKFERQRLDSGRAGVQALINVGYGRKEGSPGGHGSLGSGSRRDDFYPPGGGSLPRQMGDAVARSIAGPYNFSPGVGGVMLRGEARAVDDDSELTAGDFSLVFDGSGVIGITGLRRFVTALWATYLTEVGPGISIDPISDDFSGPHAVRYIGNVINSDLGRVMREADYLMKSWSVGTSKPDVPNWKTPEDFAKKRGVIHLNSSRFWFVPEEMVFRRAGDRLMFEDGRMTLKTEYLFDQEEKAFAGKAGGKGEAKPTASPENEDWAAMFTARYAELAAKHPVLAELCEYAQYVALAKYLKQRKVPLLWFLLANRELVLTEDSPGTVESFAHKSKVIKGLEVRGGVNLQPAGGFVWDEKLRAAVTKAEESSNQGGKPAHDPQIPQVIDDETQVPPPPEVPAQTVVIAESNDGEGFATDVGIRKGLDPVLELARFRRNDLPLVQTFGRDWHLLIPFSIRLGSNKRIDYGGLQIPEVMVLRNLVSGREEAMRFDPDRYQIAGYVPADAAASVNIGLFFLTDGTLRLADKLGCEYQFDQAGRLTQMILTPQFGASFVYGEKPLDWRDYNILPFRFQPAGKERVEFGNLSLPKRLQLIDADAGSEELFVFAADGPDDRVGYLAELPGQSAWWFAALKTDGTLTLFHRSGRTIEFDAEGHFLHETLNVVKSVKSGSHNMTFEYAMIANQYRIQSATVNNLEPNSPAYRLDYSYDDRGSIEECSVATVASK